MKLIKKDKNQERYVLDPGVDPKTLIFIGIGIVFILMFVIIALLPNRIKRDRQEKEVAESEIMQQQIEEYMSSLPEVDPNITHQTNEAMGALRSSYDNSHQASLTFSNGDTLTVGLNNPSVKNALYLSPKMSTKNGAMHAYGIYMSSNMPGLVLPEDRKGTFVQGKTYILTGRTYDHIAEAENAVFWTHDHYVPGESFDTVRFFFRVVDLSARRIVGVAECGITFENGSFAVGELKDRNAIVNGSVSEKEAVQFINEAIDFITKDKYSYFNSSAEWFYNDKIYSDCVIEKVTHLYFDTVIDVDGRAVKPASRLPTREIYAVSLPSPIGPVTLYFADKYDWSGIMPRFGEDEIPVYSENEFTYTVVAVDMLRPESEESLVSPKVK